MQGKKSILPDLDRNFIFPNSSLMLAELGLGSRLRKNTGARHATISSWHLSPALAASTLTLLRATATISLPESSEQTYETSEPVLDYVRRKGRQLAAGTVSRRTVRKPGRQNAPPTPATFLSSPKRSGSSTNMGGKAAGFQNPTPDSLGYDWRERSS